MEEEKKASPKPTQYKRKLRSWSDDPNSHMLTFRAKNNVENLIECSKLSLSTIQFDRPFLGFVDISITIRLDQKLEVQHIKYFLQWIQLNFLLHIPTSWKLFI